jgi:hypothetical protein
MLAYPVYLCHLCLEAPRMSLPMLYCIVGTLCVNAVYFAWGRNKGPSAGDTERQQAASRAASLLLAKVWPLAVAGIAYPGAAGGPHAGGDVNAR